MASTTSRREMTAAILFDSFYRRNRLRPNYKTTLLRPHYSLIPRFTLGIPEGGKSARIWRSRPSTRAQFALLTPSPSMCTN